MRRGSTSPVIRQVKMTMGHHNIPTVMTKIKKNKTVLNVDTNVEQMELSYTAGRRINLYNHFQKLFGRV